MIGGQFISTVAFGAALGILAGAPLHSFAASKLDGRQIYVERCAKCHGAGGEGVKGKYDDALVGDWSVEKLTRVISKTMPEDDPGTCKGPEAEAVARYLHDAFYSREARARNKPARVELVRLTNRQYVNTVADVLRSFGPTDPVIGTQRGLKGSYHKSRRMNGDENKAFERIDSQVDFDFKEGSPYDEGKTTNAFSMSWRGSVLAEDSGDYEFIVVTPNGTRLWVNDEETPLIDASVASGDMTEHRAHIKLVGGRAYPLRLEFVRNAKDKKGSISLKWAPPHGIAELIPSRNLAPVRVGPTFVVTTPFPPDDSSVGYERGVSVSKQWDEATTQAAIEVANYVAKNLDRFSKSKASDTNRVQKLRAFAGDFVTAAFRRPLTDNERKVYIEAGFAGSPKPEDAVKRVVLLGLKSPRFLYLGANNSTDDYEIASRLSFGLWDSMPDKELLSAAAQGQLRDEKSVRTHAQRMLGDARARAKTQYFLHQWLQLNHVESLDKDDKLFPEFTPEVISDLRTSLNLFLENVVWSTEADYRELLLADYIYVNDRLAKFYGISLTNAVASGATTNAPQSSEEFVKVKLDPKQRSGVLTHPYLLAAFSYQRSTSPIHRGVFLTRNIIGRALKSPPIAVAFNEAEFSPNLTMREKVAELTRQDACQTCHAVINPLGFSLEHFDAVGRFRTKDGEKPVDAVSDLINDDGSKVRLRGAPDVAKFAVENEQAQESFVEQFFHTIVKQPALAYGPKTIDELRDSFVKSGFNIQKLAVEIASRAALRGLDAQSKPVQTASRTTPGNKDQNRRKDSNGS